jgi:hypothetical protein
MEKKKFRPHHILCERFLKLEFPDRGLEFQQVEQRLREIIQTDDEVLVEATEGVDELCQVCPNCLDNRCQSPQGNEEAVRKWDGIILKGLGMSYGEKRTSKEWRMLIKQKAPLDFCRTRCPSKSICIVFQQLKKAVL